MVLTGGSIVQVSRFIADLVLGPGIGMIPRIVWLNPRETVFLAIGGLGRSKSSFSTQEGGSGRCGSWGIIGGIKRGRVVVVKTNALESSSDVVVVIGTGIIGSTKSGGITRSDGFHGVIRGLVLTSGDIIKIGRFVGDLVLRPGVSVVSGVVGLDP